LLAAGRTPGASSTRPWSRLREPQAGSSAKSRTSTASKKTCGKSTPGHACARPCAPIEAVPSLPACIEPLIALKLSRRHLPRSLLGQALDYTLSQWPALGIYVEDGRIEIDNNLVENAIRPTAIGKKNWLFIGEAQAGQRGAILYTIIESCRRRGLDPHAYLRDVLTRLPSMTNWQIKDITPAAWGKAQQRPPLQAASSTSQHIAYDEYDSAGQSAYVVKRRLG
jgi:hypothetical protein